ncbi:MAG: hypothetical protein QMC67_12335 [Candidatus Wallbacteria bacterium]
MNCNSLKLICSTSIFILISCLALTINGCGCGGSENKAGGNNNIIAVISEAAGKIKVNSQDATVETELKDGDIVEAEKNSYAKIKYKQNQYELTIYNTGSTAQTSKLEIKALNKESKSFLVNLINGIMTFFVPKADHPGTNLAIATDEGIVSIHQTKGKVEYDGKIFTAALVEGKIKVKIANTDYDVNAGQQIISEKGKKPEIKNYDFMSESEKKLYYPNDSNKTNDRKNNDGY